MRPRVLVIMLAALAALPVGRPASLFPPQQRRVRGGDGASRRRREEFRWVNPHTWLYVTVDDGKGSKVEWATEGRAPGVLLGPAGPHAGQTG